MSDGVRAAWITAAASIVAAVLGAILGRPVINEITGTTDRINQLSEENQVLRKEISGLRGQIEALKSSGKSENHRVKIDATPTGDPTQETSPCPPGEWVQRDAELCVQLQECRRQGGSVTCSLVLTSIDADRSINIGPHGGWHRIPILHDELGSSYELRRVGIGNESDDEVTHLLVANIHTPCQLEFGDVNQRARQASRLWIALYLGYEGQGDGARKEFEFRGVPIE